MTIHGSDPLHTDEASFVLGETLVQLQRRIRDDLKAAESDGRIERPVLGAVVCLRALLEAFPGYGFHCHTKDIEQWREQYLAWFDANQKRIRRLSAKERKLMREKAVSEFERVLAHTEATCYRLGDD
jgi:hypothetical protein